MMRPLQKLTNTISHSSPPKVGKGLSDVGTGLVSRQRLKVRQLVWRADPLRLRRIGRACPLILRATVRTATRAVPTFQKQTTTGIIPTSFFRRDRVYPCPRTAINCLCIANADNHKGCPYGKIPLMTIVGSFAVLSYCNSPISIWVLASNCATLYLTE